MPPHPQPLSRDGERGVEILYGDVKRRKCGVGFQVAAVSLGTKLQVLNIEFGL